jgi:hypothetical protein
MDINDGVKLEYYELIKAKINNSVEIQSKKSNSEVLKAWAHRLDNEWLYFFKRYIQACEITVTSDYMTEEELEIRFICYCFDMVQAEEEKQYIDFMSKEAEYNLEVKDIERVFGIMENLVCKFEWLTERKKEENLEEKYNYTVENYEDEVGKEREIIKYIGAYWNLKYEDYDFLIREHMDRLMKMGRTNKTFIDDDYRKDYQKDIVLWQAITSLNKSPKEYKYHLLWIKRIVNNLVCETRPKVWLSAPDNGSHIYYTKYLPIFLPSYGICCKGKNIKNIIDEISNEDNYKKKRDELYFDVMRISRSLSEFMELEVTEEKKDEIIRQVKSPEIKTVIEETYKLHCDFNEWEENYKEIEECPYISGLISKQQLEKGIFQGEKNIKEVIKIIENIKNNEKELCREPATLGKILQVVLEVGFLVNVSEFECVLYPTRKLGVPQFFEDKFEIKKIVLNNLQDMLLEDKLGDADVIKFKSKGEDNHIISWNDKDEPNNPNSGVVKQFWRDFMLAENKENHEEMWVRPRGGKTTYYSKKNDFRSAWVEDITGKKVE